MSSERLSGAPMTPMRHYQHPETGHGVLLVAAAHVADQSYYNTLQAALIDFEANGGVVQHEMVAKATPAELATLGRVDRFRVEVSRYSDRTSNRWPGSRLALQTAALTYAEGWQRRDACEIDLTRRIGSMAILSEGLKTFLADQVIGRIGPDFRRRLYVYLMACVLEYVASSDTRKYSRESAATIDYRNGVALAAFDEQVAREPGRGVALLWGYGHFAGLADGLEARGYLPVGEDDWVPLFANDGADTTGS